MAARRGGIQWGLLINLAFMFFLFSGGMWRNTVMITLAILIYLYAQIVVATYSTAMFRSQTGFLNLQFQFNMQNRNANNNNAPAAAGGANAAAAPQAAPARPNILSELVTFFVSLVVSLFPGYNPPVAVRPEPAAQPLDDEDDPAEVLRRIDDVYDQQERERADRNRAAAEDHED